VCGAIYADDRPHHVEKGGGNWEPSVFLALQAGRFSAASSAIEHEHADPLSFRHSSGMSEGRFYLQLSCNNSFNPAPTTCPKCRGSHALKPAIDGPASDLARATVVKTVDVAARKRQRVSPLETLSC
jgi:uncharacterized protein (DUF2461 family)